MQWIHQVNIRPNLFETEAVAEATVVNISVQFDQVLKSF